MKRDLLHMAQWLGLASEIQWLLCSEERTKAVCDYIEAISNLAKAAQVLNELRRRDGLSPFDKALEYEDLSKMFQAGADPS
jgi:hypothetical protein